MPEIKASLVKELRQQTGAGMMDCKRALTEMSGDMDQSVDWLRRKGLAAAAKKAGRVASEGLVTLLVDGHSGALVEVNAETDFVARNEEFQGFSRKVARLALMCDGNIDHLKRFNYSESGLKVEEELVELVGRIGENMVLRRSGVVSVQEGVVGSYIHNSVKDGMGKIGVVVGLESSGEKDTLLELGRKLAMHICAAKPEAIERDGLDPNALSRERDVLRKQAKDSGKESEIIDKIVDGRLRKYYEEVVLKEQIFLVDGESRVDAIIDAVGKEIGAPIEVSGFLRFELGEGIEKVEEDFATEVAAQIKG